MNNQRIPTIEMVMSNTGIQSQRKALWGVATIAFAVTLHPARANAQGGGAPTDPQIVGIVEAANQIDIDYAKLAMSKAKDKQVKNFAQQMITDHSSVQKSVRDLAAKLNVTPAESDTSNSLKTQAQQTRQKLNGLKGKDFEKAYVDNEVAYHEAVINATKTVLIPSAQNAELKSALQGAEPLFEGHLQHAQHVQSGIQSGVKQASNASAGRPRIQETPQQRWLRL
jgi:putative membrane protein